MTDFRALCVELTDCLEKSDWPRRYKPVFEQWIYIAHKALAEPEPEGPTDEELLETVRHLYGDQMAADMGAADDLLTARAVLARWGK